MNKTSCEGKGPHGGRFFSIVAAVLTAAGLIVLTGCISASSHTRQNASVVDFLFPGGAAAPVKPGIPGLNLPLKVGVAFVPAPVRERNYYTPEGTISEPKRLALLNEISKDFEGLNFVKEIEIIPSA